MVWDVADRKRVTQSNRKFKLRLEVQSKIRF